MALFHTKDQTNEAVRDERFSVRTRFSRILYLFKPLVSGGGKGGD